MNGSLLKMQKGNVSDFSLADVSPGTYILKALAGKKTYTYKVIRY